jgi:hypothetical protein
MRKGNLCSLKVRSVFLLDILNMSKVIEFFNLIAMEFLLEKTLNFDENILAREPNSTFVPF